MFKLNGRMVFISGGGGIGAGMAVESNAVPRSATTVRPCD